MRQFLAHALERLEDALGGDAVGVKAEVHVLFARVADARQDRVRQQAAAVGVHAVLVELRVDLIAGENHQAPAVADVLLKGPQDRILVGRLAGGGPAGQNGSTDSGSSPTFEHLHQIVVLEVHAAKVVQRHDLRPHAVYAVVLGIEGFLDEVAFALLRVAQVRLAVDQQHLNRVADVDGEVALVVAGQVVGLKLRGDDGRAGPLERHAGLDGAALAGGKAGNLHGRQRGLGHLVADVGADRQRQFRPVAGGVAIVADGDAHPHRRDLGGDGEAAEHLNGTDRQVGLGARP